MQRSSQVINCQEGYAQAVSHKAFLGFSLPVERQIESKAGMWKNDSSFSGIFGFIQLPDAYFACVISNISCLNPTLNLIFKMWYSISIVVYFLLLTVELNSTAIHSCQLGKTKPAPQAHSHCPHTCTNDTLLQARSHPSQMLLPPFKEFPSRKGDPPSVLLIAY